MLGHPRCFNNQFIFVVADLQSIRNIFDGSKPRPFIRRRPHMYCTRIWSRSIQEPAIPTCRFCSHADILQRGRRRLHHNLEASVASHLSYGNLIHFIMICRVWGIYTEVMIHLWNGRSGMILHTNLLHVSILTIGHYQFAHNCLFILRIPPGSGLSLTTR